MSALKGSRDATDTPTNEITHLFKVNSHAADLPMYIQGRGSRRNGIARAEINRVYLPSVDVATSHDPSAAADTGA